MGCRAALGLLALALVPALCAGGPPIRGLDPALGPRYEPTADGKFACLDGKKSVPFEQVGWCEAARQGWMEGCGGVQTVVPAIGGPSTLSTGPGH